MENNSFHQNNVQEAINQENELSIRDYLFILRLHIKKILFPRKSLYILISYLTNINLL